MKLMVLRYFTNDESKTCMLNVIFYLNKSCQPHNSAQLELWVLDIHVCRKAVASIFNGMVVFEIQKQSLQDHQKKLNVPKNIIRKTIALYYYMIEPDPSEEYDGITSWQQTDH